MPKIIQKYLPHEHPTKKAFRKKRIPNSVVAKYLGLSTNYVCALLNGGMRTTPEIDRKLVKFAEAICSELPHRRESKGGPN